MNAMLRKTASGLALLVGGLLGLNALAAEYHFGVNAEVSYKESEADVRQRYSALLDELGKATGNKFIFSSVYSDRVAQAIESKKYDFLLIHTHLAVAALKKQNT